MSSNEIGMKEEVLFGPQVQVIDGLRRIRTEYAKLIAKRDRVKTAFDRKIDAKIAQRLALEKQCSHYMLDGSSAWEGGFMFSQCKICGVTD